MQSVSDWTESKANFGGSDRPAIVVKASDSFNFMGDLLVVPFYKPKDVNEDAALTQVAP